jgi:hypothetical protein
LSVRGDDARNTLLALKQWDASRVASHSHLIEEYPRQLVRAKEQNRLVE